jgi:secreted PhoX family phosphatase
MKLIHTRLASSVALVMFGLSNATAQTTAEPAQVTAFGAWTTSPVFTIGETINGYTPPGIPDGMGAFERDDEVVIISNHELRSTQGYPYYLANGTELMGARVSSLSFDKASRELVDMGLAYDVIYNRAGESVDDSLDLDFGGLNRLCSAGSFASGQAGFVDDIFLTGEETGGGTEFALDVANGELWAAPWMGRAAWESVAALEVPGINDTHIAILVGDDRGDAPLLLYVGEKMPGGSFLERNGLAHGKLFMWVADDGELSPADWNGTGTSRSGKFVEVENYNAGQAGSAGSQSDLGFDDLGFATQAELDSQKVAIGAFNFSRPEDLHTNPRTGKGNQAVFASTGRVTTINQGADYWGTTYLVDVKINRGRIENDNITADINILYDGDDAGHQFPHPDFGIRSPDNLVWADDGMIYIQEDRSTSVRVPKDPSGCDAAADPAECWDLAFGGASSEETSLWKLDPTSGVATRIGQVDRAAVPSGQVDIDPLDLGDWETSGVIDVTDEFDAVGERLLFLNAQSHSLGGGIIDSANLVQGGQFLFLSADED